MPTSVESPTCTIVATGVNNSDRQLIHTGILKYNICTQASAWLTPQNCYQEWWEVRPQGDIGIGSTSCHLPSSLPWSWPNGIAGPSDLAYGPLTGKTTQLTFFNNIRPNGNPITNVAAGSWDWAGTYFVSNYLRSDNTTHRKCLLFVQIYVSDDPTGQRPGFRCTALRLYAAMTCIKHLKYESRTVEIDNSAVLLMI